MKKTIGFLLIAVLAVTLCATALVGCKSDEAEKFPDLTFSQGAEENELTVKGNADSKSTLKELVIPETLNGKPVTLIAAKGFQNFTALEKVTLPNSLIRIGNSAFSGCSSLKEIVLPDSVVSIGLNSFEKCKNLSSVKFNADIKKIPENAFSGCSSLACVTFPSSLEEIGNSAFSECSALNGIKFPETLQVIGKQAFSKCSALTSVKLPAALNSIGEWAFGYNNGDSYPGAMTKIYFYGDVPETFDDQILGYTWDAEGFEIFVPSQYLDNYKNVNQSNWKRCVVDITDREILKGFDPASVPYND